MATLTTELNTATPYTIPFLAFLISFTDSPSIFSREFMPFKTVYNLTTYYIYCHCIPQKVTSKRARIFILVVNIAWVPRAALVCSKPSVNICGMNKLKILVE